MRAEAALVYAALQHGLASFVAGGAAMIAGAWADELRLPRQQLVAKRATANHARQDRAVMPGRHVLLRKRCKQPGQGRALSQEN